MPLFLGRFKYSAEAIKAMIDNPQDRGSIAAQAAESLGCTLHGFWWALGLVLVEADSSSLPDLAAAEDAAAAYPGVVAIANAYGVADPNSTPVASGGSGTPQAPEDPAEIPGVDVRRVPLLMSDPEATAALARATLDAAGV